MSLIDEGERSASEGSGSDGDDHPEKDDEIYFVDLHGEHRDEFQRVIDVHVQGGASLSCTARIDTGCPITLVQESLVNSRDLQTSGQEWNRYRGINNSKLKVKGIVQARLTWMDVANR